MDYYLNRFRNVFNILSKLFAIFDYNQHFLFFNNIIFFELFISRNQKTIECHCFVFVFNCVKLSNKSSLIAFVFNFNRFLELKCLSIETSMKRFFKKFKTFWIFIANAKNFVNLFLTSLFNMKIKRLIILKKSQMNFR